MGFLSDIQTVLVGGNKKKPQELPPPARIMIVPEPGPTREQEIKAWMDRGEMPSKVKRMEGNINQLFGHVNTRTPANENQFVNKTKKRYGDPNNIDEAFKDPWMKADKKTNTFKNDWPDSWNFGIENKKRRR